MKNDIVSVVIPVYNGAKYLEKALQSVANQSYQNLEWVIVNDGSKDNTGEIISQWQERYSNIVLVNHETNLGFVQSLNDGIKKAQGAYIARLDADDVWLDSKKIEKQVDFLKQYPEYVLVGGGIITTREKDGKEMSRYLFPEKDEEIRKSLLSYNLFAHSAVVFLKSAFIKAGEYDKKFGFFADADLWLKMGLLGKFYNFQEYFTAYMDKESDDGKYVDRNNQIRRKFSLRCSMKWSYRRKYKGIIRAIILSFGSYVYSFLPLNATIKPILFKIRTSILGSPYKY